jgi:hypothetical protein
MAECAAIHGAEVAHFTRGRLRLKLARGNKNPELLEQIKATISTLPGIEQIELRPASGSIVVIFDPDHEPDIAAFVHSAFGRASAATAARSRANGGEPAHADHAGHAGPPPNKLSETTQEIEEEAEFLAEHSHVARVIVDMAKDLDRQLKRVSHNNLDLKIMVPVGLAAVTILEIGATAATPMWVTLAIFSLNHFVELHAHDGDDPDYDKSEAKSG